MKTMQKINFLLLCGLTIVTLRIFSCNNSSDISNEIEQLSANENLPNNLGFLILNTNNSSYYNNSTRITTTSAGDAIRIYNHIKLTRNKN